MGAPGPIVTHFPKPPPIVTRYAVPAQLPQYSSSPRSYGPSPILTPNQHPGSAAPGQSYAAAQGSYPPPQYGGSPSPYSHSPSAQSYSAPPLNSQYGQVYQPPQHIHHSPTGATQYNASPMQAYGPPAAQYQSPVGHYTPRSNSYSGPHPPQWSNSTTVSASSPFNAPLQQQPHQQRQVSSAYREYSGTPSQQPSQNPQTEYEPASDTPQQTPQTSTPGFNNKEPAQTSSSSPINAPLFPPATATGSAPSSRASTPYGRYGSISNPLGKQDPPSISTKSSPATPIVHLLKPISLANGAALKGAGLDVANQDMEEECNEEGEYTEQDLLQDQFNWDFKKIFKEPTPTEHVALSQPLSYTFTVTPVPLMDPRWAGSVSRYARKENLKEYLKPIRTQPQWDYLKEDPAFSDVTLEGPMIPLKEVREWMVRRQGIEEASQIVDRAMTGEVIEESAKQRKRAWSGEQEDIENMFHIEGAVEQIIEQPSKRRKNEDVEEDFNIVGAPGTPSPGTPIIGRSGTPTFGVADDVWAPEPGEAASTPMDPTEALLASLGVSGAPKPVHEESLPTATEDPYATPPVRNIPNSMSPEAQISSNIASHNNAVQNLHLTDSQGSLQGPSQIHPGYGNPQYNNPQQGSPRNGNPYGGLSYQHVPYPNHEMPVYNHNLPTQPNQTPSQQAVAQYNQHTPQRQSSFAQNQSVPPQTPYSSQGQYGPPPNQYPHQSSYNAPPNSQYGPLQSQWNPPLQGHYNGPPQYGPPQGQYGPPQSQYGGPPQGQYSTPQGPYGEPQQSPWGPPYGQHVPPQGQYNNGYLTNQGPSQHESHAYPPQDSRQHANSPQQGNTPYQKSNNQGPQPPRQDSGYASARGSYSTSSDPHGPNDFSNRGSYQQVQQGNEYTQRAKPPCEAPNVMPSIEFSPMKKEASGAKASVESEDARDYEIESPLSPTSAEILGKLTQPDKPRKIIRVISGKNKIQADDSAKKSKRPAPLVAEAYRYERKSIE